MRFSGINLANLGFKFQINFSQGGKRFSVEGGMILKLNIYPCVPKRE